MSSSATASASGVNVIHIKASPEEAAENLLDTLKGELQRKGDVLCNSWTELHTLLSQPGVITVEDPNVLITLQDKGNLLSTTWNELYNLIAAYQTELSSRESQVVSAWSQIEPKEKFLSENKGKMKAMEEELKKKTELALSTQTSMNLLAAQQKKLESDVEGQRIKLDKYETECEDRETVLSKLTLENMDLTARVEELESDLDKVDPTKLEREAEIEKLRAEVVRLLDENLTVSNKLKAAETLAKSLSNPPEEETPGTPENGVTSEASTPTSGSVTNVRSIRVMKVTDPNKPGVHIIKQITQPNKPGSVQIIKEVKVSKPAKTATLTAKVQPTVKPAKPASPATPIQPARAVRSRGRPAKEVKGDDPTKISVQQAQAAAQTVKMGDTEEEEEEEGADGEETEKVQEEKPGGDGDKASGQESTKKRQTRSHKDSSDTPEEEEEPEETPVTRKRGRPRKDATPADNENSAKSKEVHVEKEEESTPLRSKRGRLIKSRTSATWARNEVTRKPRANKDLSSKEKNLGVTSPRNENFSSEEKTVTTNLATSVSTSDKNIEAIAHSSDGSIGIENAANVSLSNEGTAMCNSVDPIPPLEPVASPANLHIELIKEEPMLESCDVVKSSCIGQVLQSENLANSDQDDDVNLPLETSEIDGFECDVCARLFFSNTSLRMHKLRVHSENSVLKKATPANLRQFPCEECNECFDKRSNLRQHVKDAHGITKPHRCGYCGKRFQLREQLATHHIIHKTYRPHKCEECELSFPKKSQLVRHLRTHSGARPFVCSQCKKSYTDAYQLTLHKRSHTNSKPFICEICAASFRCNWELKRHVMAVHADRRPHKCKDCGKEFRRMDHLRLHIRTHTGEKPFMCEVCDRSFAQRGDLHKHKFTHTQERPFFCVCGKTYALKSTYVKHLESHLKRENLETQNELPSELNPHDIQVKNEPNSTVVTLEGGGSDIDLQLQELLQNSQVPNQDILVQDGSLISFIQVDDNQMQLALQPQVENRVQILPLTSPQPQVEVQILNPDVPADAEVVSADAEFVSANVQVSANADDFVSANAEVISSLVEPDSANPELVSVGEGLQNVLVQFEDAVTDVAHVIAESGETFVQICLDDNLSAETV